MSNGKTGGTTPGGRTPVPWLAIIIGIVVASPVLNAVRRATEPSVGAWGAFGLGVLAASAVGLPALLLADWIVRREQPGRVVQPAAMVYRPALVPVGVFGGAVLQNLPSALTEWAAWAYLGWLVASVAAAVLLQHRRGRAWSWWAAVPAGFAIALGAWLGAMGVVNFAAPHGAR